MYQLLIHSLYFSIIQKLFLDDCLSKHLSAIDSTKSELTDSD